MSLWPIMSGPLAGVLPGDVVATATGRFFVVSAVTIYGVTYGRGYRAFADGRPCDSVHSPLRRATALEAAQYRDREREKQNAATVLAGAFRL